MIEIINCHGKLNLESRDFTKIIKGMNDAGLKSVIWQSKISFLTTAGITTINNRILDWIGYYNINGKNSFIYRADLFVEDKNIIYVLNESEKYSDSYRRIEFGVLSENTVVAAQLLSKYVKQFEVSLRANVDGRRVRHMELKWYKFSDNDLVDSHVTYYKNFTYPSVNESDLNAALHLKDLEARQVLRKISEQESSKNFDTKGDQKKAVIDKLISWDLVTLKYLVSCKKNGIAIAVVQSKDEIIGQNAIALHCPHCRRMFADELIKENFIISELGKKMTRGSHWMTILLTDALLASGISEKSIIWNLTEDSEEVDCVVQFKDQVWIFELKDRNFESGDAHPLTYRAVKFKANRTVVFTTGKVTDEARKVFKDMSRNSIGGSSNGVPMYIEGLLSLQPVINNFVENETLLHVSKKAKQISQTAGVDFSPIFSEKLGNYNIELENGRKESINIFR